MNSLVQYASDSESDSGDPPIRVVASKQPSTASSPSAARSDVPLADQPRAPAQDEREPQGLDRDGDTEMKNATGRDNGDAAQTVDDDDYVSAALKELHSFAAAIHPGTDESWSSSMTSKDEDESRDAGASMTIDSTDLLLLDTAAVNTECVDTTLSEPTCSTPRAELTDEQQLVFDAFLREIDAIPPTSKDQSRPPPDLPSSSLDPRNGVGADVSQPLGSSPTNGTTRHPSVAGDSFSETQWQRTQTAQSIYSRMYQLSLLSSPTIDQKDIESQLIEFAIRILDWEQGGMKPEYFLGEERAKTLASKDISKRNSANNGGETSDDSEGEDQSMSEDDDENPNTSMPPYGGVVGEMLERMYSVEQSAAPVGWKAVWDTKDGSYVFQHIATNVIIRKYRYGEES
ncbi:hypothetical protein BGZ58_007169 [Dissophora ornata]|nr:hypothetical protein BGZ58_007169 [Dissophora ornata]